MTDDPYDAAINVLVAKIGERMQPILEDQRTVNRLCALAGRAPLYPDAESGQYGARSIKRDQFHGKPLSTAVKQYLELRGPSDRGGLGAATVNEIFDALVEGGYKPETSDELHAKRGLRIALTKNSYLFYRVSSDRSEGGSTYGLLEWYPNAKPQTPDDDAPPKRKRGRPAKVNKQKRGRPPGRPATTKDAASKGEPGSKAEGDAAPMLKLIGGPKDEKAA
jgi:hypothetical protein